MSNNNLNNTLRNIDKVASHSNQITEIVGLVGTVATLGVAVANQTKEEAKNRIDISIVCNKNYPMTIQEAQDHLHKLGVESTAVPIKANDAKPKYRLCSAFQVVHTNPKNKIVVGDVPQLFYVTQEVIDISWDMYRNKEIEKHEKKLERKEKQLLLAQKAKDIFKKKKTE